ncbi:hypothetical protein E0485_22095 [Paenibacillus albiflavus]|uniref:N-acyl amino acid synthase FeeM catalytic core domain-containing protein n=1 Tax=Paenibacillus albiflavus TaxID=2545760 RepID=A0A4R4E5E5_9BACL|nr:hypothetical protein [Paenibacillus albiflavus]TCZ72858.1 hypothetical protein E0485_22095 [Paenibacillus albiflavus]
MSEAESYQFDIAQGLFREKAIRLHHQRYEEVGFFASEEADPYEKLSKYFMAQTSDQNVVGVTRLINTQLEDLPTIKNFHIYDINKAKLNQIEPNRIAEISAFTKMPAHDVGMGLIKTVLQYSLQAGLTHWICCIDERVYNYMHRMFKFPFQVIGEPKVYLGSSTVPCILNLKECLSNLKERRSKLHEYFMENEQEALKVSL